MVLPADLAVGIYYVCARSDEADSVDELDEDNNTACTTTTLSVP